jgi:hypothetical protein
MSISPSEKDSSADRAYHLGIIATSGGFGQSKKAIGELWLAVARQSGSKLEALELERKEIVEKAVRKIYDDAIKKISNNRAQGRQQLHCPCARVELHRLRYRYTYSGCIP